MSAFHYVGEELDTFVYARNALLVQPRGRFIGGDVLEVDAGIGANTAIMKACAGPVRFWTALEPGTCPKTREDSRHGSATAGFSVGIGTTSRLLTIPQFDSVLYIDVLEHIEWDREEMELAAALLGSGGHIVVLAPAHQWLYTRFDRQLVTFAAIPSQI